MASLIELRGLTFSYRQRARETAVIRHCDLEVDEGESIAIVGTSGSGKSTLLGILGGILRPSSGSYRYRRDSLDTDDERRMAAFRRDHVGYVFQNFCLLPQLNLLDNVLLPISVSGLDHMQWHARGRDLLDRVGLGQLERRFPGEISGGQAQRVAIARALIRSPSLLLADEPTGNLDTETAASIIELLQACRDPGGSLILVTHSSEVARRMRRVVEMRDGVLVQEAPACA